MRHRIIFSLLFSLLVIGSAPTLIGVGASSLNDNATNIQIPSSQYFEFLQGRVDDYVVFAKSTGQFNQLLKNYEVKRAFPHIQAVILSTTLRDAVKLTDLGRVIPSEMIPTTIPKGPEIVSHRGIGLDSTEDAAVMNVDDLWAMNYTGQGVTLGMIDDGVIMTHPNMKGRILNQTWFDSDTALGTRSPEHGVWVAGTMVGTGDDDPLAKGNAFNSTLIAGSLRSVVNDQGQAATYIGENGEFLLAAYDFMIANNDSISVINISSGMSMWSEYFFAPILEKMEASNILVVASAGNEGPDPNTIACPSCTIQALSVGASIRDSKNSLAGFSSHGPGATPIMKPDVYAPGVDVYTTDKSGGYARVDGTSFSSPLTAGAIAVLISALNQEGINWNIGSLKAAIIRGAFISSGSSGSYDGGAGIVDLKASYDYLKSYNTSFANAVVLTPRSSSLFNYETLSEITTFLKGYSIITSNMSDVSLSIEGELAPYAKIVYDDWNNSAYSQRLTIELNTTGLEQRTYTGLLVARLGDQNATASISVNILGKAKGALAMDLRHTDWDDSGADIIGGTNTGEMVKLMIRKGIWVEEVTDELTPTVLSRFDVLWMPDPFDTFNFTGEYFTSTEISAIEDFVDSGGSVLIDFNGAFISQGSKLGLNAAKLNELTERWGMSAYDDANQGDINVKAIPLNNVSTIVGGAKTVTQAGNWIALNQTAASLKNAKLYALTGTMDKTNLAIYDQIGGGRVVMTSTNFWMDNVGALGGYLADGDNIISRNTIDWLVSTDRLQVVSEEMTADGLTVTVKTTNGTAPKVRRMAANGFTEQIIDVTDNQDGTFTFTYSGAGQDGLHEIEVSYASEYTKWYLKVDIEGPAISSSIENGSHFAQDKDFVFVDFTIKDKLYDVSVGDIQTELDGQPFLPTQVTAFFSNGVLKVKILPGGFDAEGPHIITIRASDDSGHTTEYNWWFYIDIASDTSSSTSSTATDTGTSTKSPIEIFPVLFAVVMIPILVSKKKRKY